MIAYLGAVLGGAALLAFSADRFVDGASTTAKFLRVPPLIIGMVIIGFGTSAPEFVVSTTAALQGNSSIALGNAVGSNIANIGLILGVTALVSPVLVRSRVLRTELPVLLAVTALLALVIAGGQVARWEAAILLAAFAALMGWTIRKGLREQRQKKPDTLRDEVGHQLEGHHPGRRMAIAWTVIGLVLLVLSSRLLVWGAVGIAERLGLSDFVIGLTVVAIGTSLPELASAIIAVRKGLHEMALGNVIGSNLFNTLAVVGASGMIAPIVTARDALPRDLPVLAAFTLAIVAFGWRPGKKVGSITRIEGAILVLAFLAYTALLLATAGG